MRHIDQQQTDEATSAIVYLTRNYKTWSDIDSDLRNAVPATVQAYGTIKKSLASEQAHLCCYCECSMSTEPADEGHIEHIKPRSKHRECEFDYSNLAQSCNGGESVNSHCGHHKGNSYDDSRFVSPHDPRIEGLFLYDTEGGVSPADVSVQLKAEHMIQSLNLNCARLTNMRKTHGRPLQDFINDFVEKKNIEGLTEFARFYLVPDSEEGRLWQFYSLSEQLFTQYIADLLRHAEEPK